MAIQKIVRSLRNATLAAVILLPFAAAAHASPASPTPDYSSSSAILDKIAKLLGL